MSSSVKLLAVMTCLSPAIASAQDDAYGYRWSDSRMKSGIGIGTMLGGGLARFTSEEMRDVVSSDVGALWDVRITVGTHIPLGVDLSYVGTLAEIDALTGAQTGKLLGTSFEAALRWNLLPRFAWNPYLFGGVGYQRYDIVDDDGTFSVAATGIASGDNSVAFPVGGGFAFRDASGVVLELRGTYRVNSDADMVLESPRSRSFVSMSAWSASASFGYEW
jgi:hypothetical protein